MNRYVGEQEGVSLTNDHLLSLSSRDIIMLTSGTRALTDLRRIAYVRFGEEARMIAGDNNDPFISWPTMNSELQPWLPVLLAKTAQQEFANKLNGRPLLIVAAPASATPYLAHIQEHDIFPNASFPTVLKKSQLNGTDEELVRRAGTLEVSSYVHNRKSKDAQGLTQTMYFFEPEVYAGADVLVFDDVVAEGITIQQKAAHHKNKLGAARVFAATALSKDMQGGEALLTDSGILDGLSVLVRVRQTHGAGEPIDFY